MDPLVYLNEQDPDKRILMQALADKIQNLHKQDMRQLARLIRNEIADALG